jgi:hypothetical protein
MAAMAAMAVDALLVSISQRWHGVLTVDHYMQEQWFEELWMRIVELKGRLHEDREYLLGGACIEAKQRFKPTVDKLWANANAHNDVYKMRIDSAQRALIYQLREQIYNLKQHMVYTRELTVASPAQLDRLIGRFDLAQRALTDATTSYLDLANVRVDLMQEAMIVATKEHVEQLTGDLLIRTRDPIDCLFRLQPSFDGRSVRGRKEDIQRDLQELRRDLSLGSDYDHLAQFAELDEELVVMKADIDALKTITVHSQELIFLLNEHLEVLMSFFKSAYPESMCDSNQQTYFPKEHFFFTPAAEVKEHPLALEELMDSLGNEAYLIVNGQIHAPQMDFEDCANEHFGFPKESFDAIGYEEMWRKLVNKCAEVLSMEHDYEELLNELKILKTNWKVAWDKDFSPAAMARRFAHPL